MAEAPQLGELLAWAEVVNAPRGHVFFDETVDGVRNRIWRGHAYLLADVAVPSNHPLAGFSGEQFPIDVHWGVNETWDAGGWYFYKWDYGHHGDCCIGDRLSIEGKKWTVEMVKAELVKVHSQTVLLARLAELIYMNGKVGR
jgi:hypothetical protein